MNINQVNASESRKIARKHIGLAVAGGARTRKQVNASYPFVNRKGYEYECWRSEVSAWFGGKSKLKGTALEQSAVSILHHAGLKLQFGVGAVEQLKKRING